MAQQEQQASSEVSPERRVLLAVDNSEHAEAAFNYYVEHIHKPENHLTVFHVSDQVKMPAYALYSEGVGFSPDQMMVMIDELRERNKALEEKYNKLCCEHKIKHKVLVVTEDPHGAGHAICEIAKKHEVGLIVVGTRGLGIVRRTILGSVSTYVIHHSNIPTLVCPAATSQ